MSARFVMSQQVIFKNGKIAAGALANFYEPGTSTRKAVYQDSALSVPHTNPVVADANGYFPTIYLDGAYKYVVTDSKGVVIDDDDNYSGAAAGDLPADLASPSGAAMVGLKHGTVGDAIGYLTPGMFGSETIDANFSAAMETTRAQSGGLVVMPTSAYSPAETLEIAGEFTRGISLDGQRSIIYAPDENTDAMIIRNKTGSVSSEYFTKLMLRDIAVQGGGKTGTAAGINVTAAADVTLDTVRTFLSPIGLKLNGGLTGDYRNVTTRVNGVGVYADFYDDGDGGLPSFAPNANTFYGLRCMKNDIAVRYLYNPSGAVNWIGSNFEGNNEPGTTTDGKKVVELDNAGHQNFIGCHLESNHGEFGIWYKGNDATKNLLMLGTECIHGTGTVLHMERGRLTSVGSRINNGSVARDMHLNTGASATLIDTEGRTSGDASKLIGIRDGRIGFGINPVGNAPLLDARSEAISASFNIVANYRNDIVQHRWQNSAGTRIGYLQWNATADTTFNTDHAYGWKFNANNTPRLYIGRSGGQSVEPAADNSITCGSGGLRWSTVYAGSGAISTSDARFKTSVIEMTHAEISAAKALSKEIGTYQFLAAVAEKGGSARRHVGMTVQRAIEVMEAHGLNPFDYGFICYDQWEDQVEMVPAVYETQETGEFDAQGNYVMVNIETEPERARVVTPAGNCYSFRVDELLMFIARGFEARLTALEVS